MESVSLVKQLGAVAIIAGTAVGAGMLGIPFAVAAVGINYSVLLLLLVWVVMFSTAMLTVEACSSQPLGSDMDTISYNILGKLGRFMNVLFYVLLLYSLITAYVYVGGSLFEKYFFSYLSFGSSALANTVFCLVFGFVLYRGIRVVFKVNEFFLVLKIIALLLFIVIVAPKVQLSILTENSFGVDYTLFAIPILVTSFGFHIVIPSIRNYFKNDVVVKKVVAIGAITPLIIYLIWVFVTLGTISLYGTNGFINLVSHNETIAQGYKSFGSSLTLVFINLFENCAVVTSFLGVALSLLSFNCDLFRLNPNQPLKKILALIICLLPCLLFSIYFVNSFIAALGYASIFIAYLLVMQPALMVWRIRNKNDVNNIMSKVYLASILLSGVGIIVLQLLVAFGRLQHI